MLKLEKKLDDMPSGSAITVLATDEMAAIDIPLYCRQRGHACLVSTNDGVLKFDIQVA